MQTGENEQALRKIIDFTRLLSILVLLLHFYFSCYGAFNELHFTYSVVNRVLANIYKLSVFKSILMAKSTALGFLIISLIGTKGKNLPRNQVVWFIRISTHWRWIKAIGLLFVLRQGFIIILLAIRKDHFI